MINLDQVKLLETKVIKLVDYFERLTKENTAFHEQEAETQAKLESYQKRIDELEVLVMGFKEDQGRIEEGILAALDRLNQFEKAMEKSLRGTKTVAKKQPAAHTTPAVQEQAAETAGASGDGQTCFEIPEAAAAAGAAGDDVPDPLENAVNTDTAPEENRDLDIF